MFPVLYSNAPATSIYHIFQFNPPRKWGCNNRLNQADTTLCFLQVLISGFGFHWILTILRHRMDMCLPESPASNLSSPEMVLVSVCAALAFVLDVKGCTSCYYIWLIICCIRLRFELIIFLQPSQSKLWCTMVNTTAAAVADDGALNTYPFHSITFCIFVVRFDASLYMVVMKWVEYMWFTVPYCLWSICRKWMIIKGINESSW